MKNVRRIYVPGSYYFFTVVTYERKPILCSPEAISRLRAAFRYTMKKYPFNIQAIVVMPDHIHCLWDLPDNDVNFSIRWGMIKRYFSLEFNAEIIGKRHKKIWQPRFWDHLIRNERDWHKHMDYIHYNPVKHGCVSMPIEWPYSSFRQHVNNGFYEEKWGQQLPDSIINVDYE